MTGQASLLDALDIEEALTKVRRAGYVVLTPEEALAADRPRHARLHDPATSRSAAARAATPKAASHKHLLLRAFYERGSHGYTDEEAGARTGLPTAWKRCSDLRFAGWIEPLVVDGVPIVRTGPKGQPAAVHRITPAGQAVLYAVEANKARTSHAPV